MQWNTKRLGNVGTHTIDAVPLPCAPTESVHTLLEVIVACHASSAKHAAGIALPLKDGDRAIEVLTG